MGFKEIRVIHDKRNRQRKTYRSISEQKHFIELWEKSTQSRGVFCDEHKLNIKTFSAWIKKATNQRHQAECLKVQTPQGTLSSPTTGLHLKLPNGALLSVTGEKGWLLSIIHEISTCNFN